MKRDLKGTSIRAGSGFVAYVEVLTECSTHAAYTLSVKAAKR